MSLSSCVHSILLRFRMPRPLLLYTATWTVLLTMTVALVSFSPEMAFVSAISPSSSFSRACDGQDQVSSVRVPLDVPGEVVCLPAHLFSKMTFLDFLVPPVFAAIAVAASACVVRAMALWEEDD
ncbi:uncharacterized protein LOC122649660 [Telopea speciosissima]|uniref:uncharacterized protein LOC122649660 n=1 Tax=Telopea speciosissima TaxID=54955 RepID=UPI001CC43ED4|nr:uncharacterized protein LOC122649660 [Telopea speciosissima]